MTHPTIAQLRRDLSDLLVWQAYHDAAEGQQWFDEAPAREANARRIAEVRAKLRAAEAHDTTN